MTRRLGLRVQLLCLLGASLLLTFLPLHMAVATYIQVTLNRVDQQQATIACERPSVSQPEEVDSGAALWDGGAKNAEGGPGQAPSPGGRLTASQHGPALIRLLGLYSLLMAVGLATMAYFGLTGLIVRPLDQLKQAAHNVTLGARTMSLGPLRTRELSELNHSLLRMTEKLFGEESRLKKKMAQTELATKQLRSAQAQLLQSEKLASVGRLAAGLAHEVGNPLAALMGLQDALLEGELTPSQSRDFLLRMRSETERIHRIVRDLLQFARGHETPEGLHGVAVAAVQHPVRHPSLPPLRGDLAGSGEPNPAPSCVRKALNDTVGLLACHPKLGQTALIAEPCDPNLQVALAPEPLAQVLLNLSLNGIEALHDKADGKLQLRAHAEGSWVRILVEDNGPGVSDEDRNHLFEPFFSTKGEGQGTGLGLSVCRGLVAAAGGRLELDPGAREGALFVVTLPAAAPEPAAAPS